MAKCRKEHFCQYGIAEDGDGEIDITDKDPRRCFKCLATGYSLFEPVLEEDSE